MPSTHLKREEEALRPAAGGWGVTHALPIEALSRSVENYPGIKRPHRMGNFRAAAWPRRARGGWAPGSGPHPPPLAALCLNLGRQGLLRAAFQRDGPPLDPKPRTQDSEL